MNATQTRLTIDGQFTTEGVDKGERWNGWVVPYLTADAITEWAAWTAQDGEWDITVSFESGVMTITEDGEISDTVTAEDDGTYRFDLGIVWSEV